MVNFSNIIQLGYALFDPSEHPLRCFHLSAILYKGRLLSVAVNSPKTHSLNLKNPKFNISGENISSSKQSCSELRAILRLKKMTNINSNKCILVNIRIGRNGQLANSAPCFSCSSLLRYFSFKNVYFTDNNGRFQIYKA